MPILATAQPNATTVDVITTPTVALAANTGRKQFTIYNDGETPVRVYFGAAASTWTMKVPADSFYESSPVYGSLTAHAFTGTISVDVESGTSSIQVTEF